MTTEPQPGPRGRPPNQPVFLNDRVVRTDAMLTMIRTVLWRMLAVTAIGAVLGSGVGWLIAQAAGVWAALIAAGIGLFFTGTTVVLIYLVVGRGPELLQIVLLGGWVVKMGVVLVLLLWLRNLDFFHREVFVGVLMLLALALVAVELVTVARTRLPAVDVSGRPAASPGSARARDDEAPGPEQTSPSGEQTAPGTGEDERRRGQGTEEDQVG